MSGGQEEVARGYLYAVLGALCSGSVPTLTKFLLRDNGPVAITGLGFLLSGFLLLLVRPTMEPTRGSLPYLLFLGLVGAGAAPLMYAVGLSQTTAVNASLLANGEVLFTTIIAFSIFGERLGKGQAVRGLLIVAGLVIVSTDLDITRFSFMQGFVGNMLILVSTVGWAVENNLIVAATKKFEVAILSKFRNLIGGVVLTAVIVAAAIPFDFAPGDVAALILLALALSGGTYLFISALKWLGAIKMLLVWSSSTIFGAAFALIFLGEQISLGQLAGGALILLGVYLFRRSEKPTSVAR